MQINRLTENLSMLSGNGSNIGVSIGQDGTLLVDTQLESEVPAIRASLESLNHKKLAWVINSHWHEDHVGGNAAFGGEASIIAHRYVRQRFQEEQHIRFVDRTSFPPLPKEAWPAVVFDNTLSLYFNGEDIRLIHFPCGHSDSDTMVWFTQSGIVHLADIFWADSFPFVDVDNGGSTRGLAQNVARILKLLPQTSKIIPGHGPLSTFADLETYHRMLVDTINIIEGQLDDGKSLEDIQSSNLLMPWEKWASAFVPTSKWIELVTYSYFQEATSSDNAIHPI